MFIFSVLTRFFILESFFKLISITGARFYAQIDAALTHNDVIEAELAKEIESARLFRLLTKLCTVVDRAELNGDFAWADYGDRYMLKLFRDYVFHQVRVLTSRHFFRDLEFVNRYRSWRMGVPG